MRKLLFAAAVLAICGTAQATWKPQYANEPKAVRQWWQAQKIMPAARRRLTWDDCCAHSDRYQTKFVAGAHKDEWYYFDKESEKYVLVPADTIHPEGIHALDKKDDNLPQFKQMRAEGVLMIYDGRVTCFWPPQPGG